MVNNTAFPFILVLISLGVLDYIHSNVFDPINVPLISRSLCFVSFVDDYCRTFVYFLRSKYKFLVSLRNLSPWLKIRLVEK